MLHHTGHPSTDSGHLACGEPLWPHARDSNTTCTHALRAFSSDLLFSTTLADPLHNLDANCADHPACLP
eukprot:271429-Lingulodinium_polyedra.AAC.1